MHTYCMMYPLGLQVPTHLFSPRRHLSSCGTGLTTDPNDFSSSAAMTAGGELGFRKVWKDAELMLIDSCIGLYLSVSMFDLSKELLLYHC